MARHRKPDAEVTETALRMRRLREERRAAREAAGVGTPTSAEAAKLLVDALTKAELQGWNSAGEILRDSRDAQDVGPEHVRVLLSMVRWVTAQGEARAAAELGSMQRMEAFWESEVELLSSTASDPAGGYSPDRASQIHHGLQNALEQLESVRRTLREIREHYQGPPNPSVDAGDPAARRAWLDRTKQSRDAWLAGLPADVEEAAPVEGVPSKR